MRSELSDCEWTAIGDVVRIDGEIDHRDVFFSDHQKSSNARICPCVSRARGVVTVDTLYRADGVNPNSQENAGLAKRSVATNTRLNDDSGHGARAPLPTLQIAYLALSSS